MAANAFGPDGRVNKVDESHVNSIRLQIKCGKSPVFSRVMFQGTPQLIEVTFIPATKITFWHSQNVTLPHFSHENRSSKKIWPVIRMK